MTTHAMASDPSAASTTANGANAAMRWIGDLDHPFYEDERNRFVWYEAQTIGFQFIGLGSYVAAAISLLIGGSSAMPYAFAMMAPFVISTFALKGYVVRRGADYWPQSADFRRTRGVAVLAIGALLLAGFVRAYLETENASSGIAGLAVGAVAAGAMLALLGRRHKNREAAQALLDD